MRQVTPAWKFLTAILSLLLTVFVWQQGLQESFNRPSVAPKLSLTQHEMALLAEPSLPEGLKPVLIGNNPSLVLKESLLEIPIEERSDRQKLVLAALEPSRNKRVSLLKFSLTDQTFQDVQNLLLQESDLTSFENISDIKKDPLLYQLACFALGGKDNLCINSNVSRSVASRFVFLQALPIFSTLLGIILLLYQGWLLVQRKNFQWPLLSSIPLTLIDMIILIAGGFVILGEVVLPSFVIPVSSYVIKGIESPVNEALKVFVGYIAMTLPPIFILRKQLNSLKEFEIPPQGWLQWKNKPLGSAFLSACQGWLMIMPFVLLTGWLTNVFIGDQGGSNPLLELVLGSHSSLALALLLTTTVVLAPFFEELIFRGVLLPVLGKKLGRWGGVIVSSLIFGLAHLSVGELPALFVLGIGLGVLRISSGRLLPCALMHSLWNGVTFANLLLLGA
tara:strand:- start:1369 stop:2712 length:1344 start_codon:yes stop_codon:yes gene_type:complete